MSVRYVARTSFVCSDKRGARRRFQKGHEYSADEMKGLYRDHLKMFDRVSGEVVEQATAAPGEKRAVSRGDTADDAE